MQNATDKFNKSFGYDMATVTKAIGEFMGDSKENIREWIDSAEMLGSLAGLSEERMLGITIMGLRNKAKIWGTLWLKGNRDASWNKFKADVIERFSDHKASDEALIRFLSTTEVKSYEGLSKLLSEARILKETKGISESHLMRQIISRAPAGLKSHLIGIARSGIEWEGFLRSAEEEAWVVFPEMIVGSIEEQKENNSVDINNIMRDKNHRNNFNKNNGKKWFCHLHGEGNHSTKFCEIIKTLESKGWVRKGRNIANIQEISEEKENLNKFNSSYNICNHKLGTGNRQHNPFHRLGRLKGKNIPVLLDTGADVSLIHKDLLPDIGKNDIQPTNTKLKTASGQCLDVIGKLKENAFMVEDTEIKSEPYVIKGEPRRIRDIGM